MIKRPLKYSFSLLNTDLVQLDTKWNYQHIVSPYHRIYFIKDGFGSLSSVEQEVELKAGFLYMIPSFTLCNMSCPDYLEQYYVQFFEESADGISLFAHKRSIMNIKATIDDELLFKRLLGLNPGRGINRSDNPKFYEKDIFYQEYQAHNNHLSLANFLETQGILLQLVSRFLGPSYANNTPSSAIPSKIQDTINYIAVHLSTKLSIPLLASRINQHPDYFSRSFEQHMGIRPLAYIQEKRIERAQFLLITSNHSLSEVAEMTGFESLSHFSRVFKKICGTTPSNFRKQTQNT